MSATDSANISKKLDTLIRLQALALVRGEPTEQAKIALLDSLGFIPGEIAKMLGKSPENIGVVISRLKKKSKVPADEPQQGNQELKTLDAT
ncbi:MAG: hypothetical protein JRN34_05010 [Nitrososphaerota archaeon]|nr:hypothetical protein [Nitrososphaerota archaeon]MDG6942268.1 hypothetical protein [Nitrososphaerota archaeon]MDG6942733.1 hypothetical protein [Nitrososphaerota archaeon]MDG6948520.1 hypothetical protein [Nitrososphaerota archaeon]MDG6950446.1 hypothetical protein [Nitrososphaerota archaeon]